MTWEKIVKNDDDAAIKEARKLIVRAYSILEQQLGWPDGPNKFEDLFQDLLDSM